MYEVNDEGVDTQTDERDDEEFGVFYAHLLVGAAPGPNAVEDVVAGGGDDEAYGVGDEFGDFEDLFAKPCQAEIDDGA